MSFDPDDGNNQTVRPSQARAPEVLPSEASVKRRQAVAQLIQSLPGQFQATLSELYRRTYSDSAPQNGRDEVPLFDELRRSLNLCVTDGLLARRQFLHISYLITSAGLLAALFPKSAQAGGPMMPFGFWKQRSSPGSGSSSYPANTGSDPYWDYVVLLMNMDTASGIANTVFADESNVGKTPTISGSPYIDTTASTSSPYSGRAGSVKFTAASSQRIAFADSTDWSFGASDFTIELWVKFSSTSSTQTLIGHWVPGVATSCAWELFLSSGATPTLYFDSYSGGDHGRVSYSWGPALNTWYHVAIVRAAGTKRIFINGTQVASAVVSHTINDCSNTLTIGSEQTNNYFDGAFADLRVYNGVAKYTANFTAPSSPIGLGTSNDKYWGYCVLACPFENSLKDMSGKRPAFVGSASLSTSSKKFGTASLSLNGTNSYLSIPAGSIEELGSSDFTLEAWIYLNSTSTFDIWNTGFDSSNYHIFRITGQKLYFSERFSHPVLIGATTLSTAQWYHVAVTRRGSAYTLFVNGVADASATDSSALPAVNASRLIGAWTDASLFANGFIDSLRITKGYARYTSNFTVPTASFPVGKDETVDPFWTYTVLAMHMDDLTDSTARHLITNNGTVTNNTTTYKYSTASTSFNGSNQYLSTPTHSDFYFGSGSFTIEFWFYLAADPGANWKSPIGQMGPTGQYSWIIEYRAGTLEIGLSSDATNVTYISASVTLAPSTWHHFAATRYGSTVTLFLNGVALASNTSYSATLYNSPASVVIGARNVNTIDQYWNGHLDDLRITKGVARYTQTFTPPTRAFATTPLSTYTDYDPFFSSLVFALSGQGTNGSKPSAELTGKSLTWNGSAQISTSSSAPFYGTSLDFNGTNAYLTSPDSADFYLAGNCTIRGKLSFTSVANGDILAHADGFTVINYYWALSYFSGALIFRVRNGATATTWVTYTWTPTVGTTYDVEVGISGSSAYLFINGNLAVTGTAGSPAMPDVSGLLYLGGGGYQAAYFPGKMNDVKIYKGICLHTASFAPPRVPMATSAGIVTSGLVALLDAGDAASYDGTSQTWKNICTSPADSETDPYSASLVFALPGFSSSATPPTTDLTGKALTYVSGATVSTSKSKFYESSVYVNAGGDRVTTASSSDFNFGTGAWCIELWLYTADLTSGHYPTIALSGSTQAIQIATPRNESGSSPSVLVGTTTTNATNYYDFVGGTWALGNAWVHIAMTYNSGTVRVFANGTLQATISVSPNLSENMALSLGSNHTKNGLYFQDVRVYKGVAKYTSNFTPPGPMTITSAVYNFMRGASSSTESSDPAFVGVASGRSANDYFSFDGGDYFTLVGANTTFLNSLHKAGATFTLTGAFFCPSSYSPSGDAIISTRTNNYDPGLTVQVNSGKTLTLYVSNGSGDTLLATSTLAMATGWNFFSISLDTAGTRLFYINGSEQTIAATYSSPSSSAASQMRIGITTDLNTGRALKAGAGLGLLSLYNRALTKAELDQNFNALRSRFGI